MYLMNGLLVMIIVNGKELIFTLVVIQVFFLMLLLMIMS